MEPAPTDARPPCPDVSPPAHSSHPYRPFRQTCTGNKDEAAFNLKLALKLSGQGSALQVRAGLGAAQAPVLVRAERGNARASTYFALGTRYTGINPLHWDHSVARAQSPIAGRD